MPKFDKPANLNTIWASEALSQNNQYPSVSYAEEGWLQVKPPYQYENALNFKHDQMLAHLNQLGIPEWDSTTEYQAGKSYVQGSNNVVYKCIQTHINKNPATSGNEAFWNVWEGNRQATTSARGTTKYATNNQAKNGLVDNVALTPANLLAGVFGTGVLAETGNIRIPFAVSGFRQEVIVQWGQTAQFNSNNETRTINFPTSFPSSCLWFDINAAGIVSGTTGSSEGMEVTSFTKSSASVISHWNSGTLGIVRWIAIGY